MAVGGDGVIDGVLPGAHSELFVAERPRGGTVQHDVLLQRQEAGLFRRVREEVQLQAAIDPVGGRWHGAVERRVAGADAADAQAWYAAPRLGNSDLHPDDEALHRGARADHAVGVGGVIDGVLTGMEDDLLVTERLRRGAVQHDILLQCQHAGLIGRVGQEAQLQVAIDPGRSSRNVAQTGGRADVDFADAEAGPAGSQPDSYPDDDPAGRGVRADHAVGIGGIINRVLPGAHGDLFVAQRA